MLFLCVSARLWFASIAVGWTGDCFQRASVIPLPVFSLWGSLLRSSASFIGSGSCIIRNFCLCLCFCGRRTFDRKPRAFSVYAACSISYVHALYSSAPRLLSAHILCWSDVGVAVSSQLCIAFLRPLLCLTPALSTLCLLNRYALPLFFCVRWRASACQSGA